MQRLIVVKCMRQPQFTFLHATCWHSACFCPNYGNELDPCLYLIPCLCLVHIRRCSVSQTDTWQHNMWNQTAARAPLTPGPSEAEGRTDRQKERERQSVSAYRWRVGAVCSPAAPRLPAALSTSPADAGPPRSRSCPSTTGSPVENIAHLLKNTAPLTPLCHQGLFLNMWLCLRLSKPQLGWTLLFLLTQHVFIFIKRWESWSGWVALLKI